MNRRCNAPFGSPGSKPDQDSDADERTAFRWLQANYSGAVL